MADESRNMDMVAMFRCQCPKCKQSALFTHYVRSVERCRNCELDLSNQDAGDGPAFFAITIVGFIVTVLATVVELKYEPPYWLHAVIWTPMILIMSIALLRLVKSYLIHLEYQLALLQEGHDETEIQ